MRTSRNLKIALCSGAFALALAATSADAQEYGPPPGYQAGPPEQVPVYAPRFRAEPTPLNGPLEEVSLSSAVPYDDLDLRTWAGAHELHRRIRDTAWTVCARLADAYPVYQAHGTSCFKTAYENGIVRADAAISDARVNARLEEY